MIGRGGWGLLLRLLQSRLGFTRLGDVWLLQDTRGVRFVLRLGRLFVYISIAI